MCMNNVQGVATYVSVTDTLPSGVSFVSVTPSQGKCSGASTVICNLGTINNSATATVTLVVTATPGGTLSNTASVASASCDPVASNNSATATTTGNNLVTGMGWINPFSEGAGGPAADAATHTLAIGE